MSIRITLDKPDARFTSLDLIAGRVLLTLASGGSISEIRVKLEGVSMTRLKNMRTDEQETDIHKVST